jgi:hypothetical protein
MQPYKPFISFKAPPFSFITKHLGHLFYMGILYIRVEDPHIYMSKPHGKQSGRINQVAICKKDCFCASIHLV